MYMDVERSCNSWEDRTVPEEDDIEAAATAGYFVESQRSRVA
jgi:hypothetical protein